MAADRIAFVIFDSTLSRTYQVYIKSLLRTMMRENARNIVKSILRQLDARELR